MSQPYHLFHSLAFYVILLVTPIAADAQQVESGLEIGKQAQSFDVKDCTGPAAGKTLCYFCRYARRPVVAIFVDDLKGQVPALIEQVDRLVGEHRAERLAAFVIYTGDDSAEIEAEMKAISRDRRIRHTPLTIVRGGRSVLEEKYAVSTDAAVTILMWREIRVEDRLAFESTELPTEAIKSLPTRVASLVE